MACVSATAVSWAQTTALTLASGSGLPGSTVALNLSLSNTATGGSPASLQFTLSYNATEFSAMAVAAGTVAAGAGKSISCNPSSGSMVCILYGMNTTTMGDGVVAIVSATLSASSSTTSRAIQVVQPVASSASGASIPITGAGGAVLVTQPAPTPALSSLGCAPTTLSPGTSSLCTVQLTAAAASGGFAVALASNNGAITVPSSVTVPSGSLSATFSATAITVAVSTSVTVTVSAGGVSKTAVLTVNPLPGVSSLSCSPASVSAPGSSSCTVTVTQAAPSGGLAVSITDNHAAVTVPASVSVAAGQTSASFTASVAALTADATAQVTATLNGTSRSATLTLVAPATLSTLVCSPATIVSGTSSTCTLTLTKAAPSGGLAATLTRSNSAVTIPASVTVAAGALSATFAATGGAVTANQSVTITAASSGTSVTATITVQPASPQLSALTCAPTTITGAGATACTVTLSAAAPAGGASVAVASNQASLTVPASVAVSAGATSATFTGTASAVPTPTSAQVSATCSGSSKTVAITLQPAVSSLPAGLLAAYSFSEGAGTTVADVSGHGITGTIVGATWTDGKYGKALSFNGSSYVDLGKPASLNLTGSMSWSAWVYATGNPSGDGTVIAKATSSHGWRLKTEPWQGNHEFAVGVSKSSASLAHRYSKKVRSLNTWYHVAGVYDASARRLKIYINGALNNGTLTGSIPSSQSNPDVNVTIGRRSDGFYFKGIIDELRVYNRVLSLSEIQADMNTPLPATASAPAPLMISQQTEPLSAAAMPDEESNGAVDIVAHSLSCWPASVLPGQSARCQMTFNSPVSEDESIAISEESLRLAVPNPIFVRAGQSSVSFRVRARSRIKPGAATLTAVLGESAVQTTVGILPQSPASPMLDAPVEWVSVDGAPVAFHVSGYDPMDLPFTLSASDLPAGARFDVQTGEFSWNPAAVQPGSYRIRFQATNSVGQSAAAATLVEVVSGTPVLGKLDAACSPGALIQARGEGLTGTRITVNGEPAHVARSSAREVAFVCPDLAPGATLKAQAHRGDHSSNVLESEMAEAGPVLLTVDGSGQALALLGGTERVLMVRSPEMPSQPATRGDAVSVLATGLGRDATPSRIGLVIGGAPATVESVTAVAPGVWQLTATVPEAASLGDDAPVRLNLTLSDGRVLESNPAAIAIEARSEHDR